MIRINIGFADEALKKIKATAAAKGLSVAGFIRLVVIENLNLDHQKKKD